MTEQGEALSLPLLEAVRLWGRPKTVAYIEEIEAVFSDEVLRDLDVCRLAGPEAPRNVKWLRDDDRTVFRDELATAWEALVRDFEQKLEEQKLFLDGVMLWPERQTDRTTIPGVWATRMQFDFPRSRVEIDGSSYAVVRVSNTPPPTAEADLSPHAVHETLTVDRVGELSDEVILALLERHAQRVVDNEGAKLLDAVKIKVSLMPLIRRKMEHRRAAGETERTLAAEMRALAAWIATKVPSHQVPTAKSIENAIGDAYQRPKA